METKTTQRELAILNDSKEGRANNLTNLLKQDIHSLEGILHKEEGRLMALETNRDNILASNVIPLGETFVDTLVEINAVTNRINFVKQALTYVQ